MTTAHQGVQWNGAYVVVECEYDCKLNQFAVCVQYVLQLVKWNM